MCSYGTVEFRDITIVGVQVVDVPLNTVGLMEHIQSSRPIDKMAHKPRFTAHYQ
jgi:hypothetical protein